MIQTRFKQLLSRVLKGYLRTARSLVFVCTIVAGIGVLSVAIVIPLWYAATHHSTGYSVAVIAALVGAWIGTTTYKAIKNPQKRRTLAKTGIRATRFVLSIAFLYAIALLFARGLLIAAIPLTVFFIVAISALIYGKKTAA